jgi:hypothetical protein
MVSVDRELRRLHPRLQEALPSMFRVGIAVSAEQAACLMVIANLQRLLDVRAASRHAFIVVYGARRLDCVAYLDAGADDAVSTCSPRELAARIQAGTRRLGW